MTNSQLHDIGKGQFKRQRKYCWGYKQCKFHWWTNASSITSYSIKNSGRIFRLQKIKFFNFHWEMRIETKLLAKNMLKRQKSEIIFFSAFGCTDLAAPADHSSKSKSPSKEIRSYKSFLFFSIPTSRNSL